MQKTKKCIMKIKLKFKDYKNCLKTTQLQNEINHFGKKLKCTCVGSNETQISNDLVSKRAINHLVKLAK